MTQVRERSTYAGRPLPDAADVSDPHANHGRTSILRMLGAVAVLVVGGVHLQQYLAGYHTIHVIGTLFLLNFIGATLIGLGLLVPMARLRSAQPLLALGGIGLAATSIVFLFISEHQPLFGFQESGYRTAILVALAAEAAAVVALGAYLVVGLRRRS